jgi:hypothetical protein
MSIEKRLDAIEARTEIEQGEKQAEEIRDYMDNKSDQELISEYIYKFGIDAFKSLFISAVVDAVEKKTIEVIEAKVEASRQLEANYTAQNMIDRQIAVATYDNKKDFYINDISETLENFGVDIKKDLVGGIMGVTL